MADRELDYDRVLANSENHPGIIEAINLASEDGTVTWLTHDGNPIAAIVPPDVAEREMWPMLKMDADGKVSIVPVEQPEPAGELYELVTVADLRPGDRIYLMAQRRTVLDVPWHPEEMREEYLRIPMSDAGPGITKLSPPFDRGLLVPRLAAALDRAAVIAVIEKYAGPHYGSAELADRIRKLFKGEVHA